MSNQSKLFDENTLQSLIYLNPTVGKLIAKNFLYWPTTPYNLQANCSIFEKMNPSGLEVSGLDENSDYYSFCCQYAYITMALKQRGIMNMTYYQILDQALINYNKSISINSGEQVGGIKWKSLLTVAFTLLGVSEGITNTEESVIIPTPSSSASAVSPFKTSPPPEIKNKEIITQYRQEQAKEKYRSIMDTQSWIIPETQITIGNINEQQKEYFIKEIKLLNSQLSSLSRDASSLCSDISTQAGYLGLFNDEDFYQQLYQNAREEEIKMSQQRTQKTVEGLVAKAYKYSQAAIETGTNIGTLNVESKEVELTPEQKQQAIDNAYQIASKEYNSQLVKEMEDYTLLDYYQKLCRAGTPYPQFELSITETDGLYSIIMNTRFGNMATGNLLSFHMTTIAKITNTMDKIGNSDKQYLPLKSLKERMMLERDLIQSSTLFVPLDLFGVTYQDVATSMASSISENKQATERFRNIIDRIGQEFPLTQQNAELQIAMRKRLQEISSGEWKQTFSEIEAFTTTVTKGTTSVLASNSKVIIDEATDMAEHTLESAEKVGTTAARGATNVAKTTLEGLREIIYQNYIALAMLLSAMGAGAFLLVWFKREMFKFSSGNVQPPATGPVTGPATGPNTSLELQYLTGLLAKQSNGTLTQQESIILQTMLQQITSSLAVGPLAVGPLAVGPPASISSSTNTGTLSRSSSINTGTSALLSLNNNCPNPSSSAPPPRTTTGGKLKRKTKHNNKNKKTKKRKNKNNKNKTKKRHSSHKKNYTRHHK